MSPKTKKHRTRPATYRLKQVREELADGRRRKRFRAETGGLARVGYLSRLVDEGAHHVYHGRVVRRKGWIVLQYWFFYPFNDWRSGFFGANNHEAGWQKHGPLSASDLP